MRGREVDRLAIPMAIMCWRQDFRWLHSTLAASRLHRALATPRLHSTLASRRTHSTLLQEEEMVDDEMDNEPVPLLRSVFAGAPGCDYIAEPKFLRPHMDTLPAAVPCFRILDDLGRIVPGAEKHDPQLSSELCVALLKTMLRVGEFDKIFYEAQRQGRISFFLTSRGEEATTVGSCGALEAEDWVLPQYRELGAFLWRGVSFGQVADHLVGNVRDRAHGRQMPMMFGDGSRRLFYVKGSLGTHVPHAAGAAYALKMMQKQSEPSPGVTLAFFGDGCASTGDVPSGMQIAAVHGCPTIFFCRNNGYAISTSSREQYASDGIAPRGIAYGMPVLRCDGNDLLAVWVATRRAREIALEEKRPVLIEAMTYRLGAHSTSDDDSKYRTAESPVAGWDSERAYWEARSPVIRFGRYLQARGCWSVQEEEQVRKAARRDAISALEAAEVAAKPEVHQLFSDVLDQESWMVREQREALNAHLRTYGDHYQK